MKTTQEISAKSKIKSLKRIEREVCRLLMSLKHDIGDEYRASDDDERPSMSVTVSTDDEVSGWNYQTGDNSYTGGCYGQPHWAVISLYRNSNCHGLAREVADQLAELINLETTLPVS